MNGQLFTINRKTYRMLEGTWMFKDGILVDAVKFERISVPTERDEPVEIYRMPESEFFAKVSLT